MFGEGAEFVSVASIVEEAAARKLEDATRLQGLVHVVFGVSKVRRPLVISYVNNLNEEKSEQGQPLFTIGLS